MTTPRIARIIVAVLLAMSVGQSAFAQDEVFLGQVAVDGLRDHDAIRLGRNEGRFRSIRLEVTGGTVEFRRVVIHFGNGGEQVVNRRTTVSDGRDTGVIDLNRHDRKISKVVFLYSTPGSSGAQPTVKLYGRR